LAENIRLERNKVLSDTIAVWYRSWLPRVSEAHGRKFVHELDDVKDHLPDRTVDMSYLVYREILLPMDEWSRQVLELRNSRAASAGLKGREFQLKWQEIDAPRE